MNPILGRCLRPRISGTVHCPCEVKGLGKISNDSKLCIFCVTCFSHKVPASSVCMYYNPLRLGQGDVQLMLINQPSFHGSRTYTRGPRTFISELSSGEDTASTARTPYRN